jgi:hypothetical protein
MTKVFIIDVDINDNIGKIINDDVATVTGKAEELLENAIAVKKKEQAIKDEKQKEAQKATDAVTNIMMEAYERLEKAGEEGVKVEELMEIVQPTVPNSSAFSLRMKNILREKGNQFVIRRKQRKKMPYYIFEPFNQED